MTYASDQGVLNAQFNAATEAQITEQARRAPHVLMRPTVYQDGNSWCALYGTDLATGVAGFGPSPAEACDAFDNAWVTSLRAQPAHDPTNPFAPRESPNRSSRLMTDAERRAAGLDPNGGFDGPTGAD